ncbi:uncharacterized protein [Coffea arabica]|uniref:Uncharacterized protein LOC113715611 isoform X1 n=1 Tax=Coffea arabica TaxID=13443 RepID=A0A6P6UZ00_COFAR|nr:uncharacterized protein LOC113715611 isoform X1 [Coffea arabica]XP_027095657.1 uncharacterized protein LOC113715611 isoform X1 [Coffea arabica]XP_027095658.1 uncharacterized protein LOC113715611 isoform X1 [Coffea arabica]
MASKDLWVKIQDHGTALDEKKTRIRCNYCGKVVSGFSRLKYHLGGIRGNVVPCVQVPNNVMEVFRDELLEKNTGNVSREVGELCSPNLPSRRNSLPRPNSAEPYQPGRTKTSGMGSEKRRKIAAPSENHGSLSVSGAKMTLGSQSAASNQCSSSREFQKLIGRFFYETGIDLDAARCPSFQKMMNAKFGSEHTAYPIPSSEDLRGWILQESVEEMQQYVREIKSSWMKTGCSILLDGWEELTGRKLLNVLVACPKGTIYIRSADITGFDEEGSCMLEFLDDVLKEVDVQNVVQIIANSKSSWMETVGKLVMGKYKTLFWTACASHCLELMLEKMGTMKKVKETMDKAKTITRFVHSHASVLKLLRSHTSIKYLVRQSKFKLAEPFLTLENLVSEQENLQNMFLSSAWKTSRWASSMEGKRVADLVADCSFWTGAELVVKATIPLVRVIDLITKNNNPQLGNIYEIMDQAKETIREELSDKESTYMPFWKAIDDIWNGRLHSPLHAAGYFLNPKLFYVNDFYTDSEITSGLLCCIVRLVEDPGSQDMISLQIEEYRAAKGNFGQGSSDLQSSLESWWFKYGSGYPQLQQLAVRILSQTCTGGTKYNLKRSLAEKLLTTGRNPIEQERLAAMVFVHYNLQLQNFNLGIANDLASEDIDPMDDWLVDRSQPVLTQRDQERDEFTWKELDCGYTINGRVEGNSGYSKFHPKKEPHSI